MKKIDYLDGLRGIAAFQVVFHHFILAFYPAVFLGAGVTTHLSGDTEVLLSGSILNLLWDGQFAVCLFFVLSGFVLSYKFFVLKEEEIVTASAVRRYFRLALPVAFSVLVAFILMKFSLFYNQQAGIIAGSNWLPGFWNFQPDFLDALNQAFLGTFLYDTFNYNAVLWTIAFEFSGSFLVFSFLAVFGKAKNRFWAYIFMIWAFLQTYYLAFILGMLASDIIAHQQTMVRSFDKKKVFRVSLFALGIFVASYPSGRDAVGTVYEFMKLPQLETPAVFYHVLGAFLLMVVLLDSSRLQRIFSCKSFLFLGKISFTMYLLHFIILGSFSSFVFLKLQPLMPYSAAVIGSFLLSLPVIFYISFVAYKYVDRNAINFARFFYEKVFNATPNVGQGGSQQ